MRIGQRSNDRTVNRTIFGRDDPCPCNFGSYSDHSKHANGGCDRDCRSNTGAGGDANSRGHTSSNR